MAGHQAVTIAYLVLLALLFWSIWRLFSRRPSWPGQPIGFFLLVSLSIFVLRWQTIRLKFEMNPDESQMLAQAMRFMDHPVPWRDVDTTTGGPLNSLLLTLPLHFGANPTWQMARMVLWGADCLTLVFLYLALRCFGTREDSQFALMPAIFFYALTYDEDFTSYSSETLPAMLLSAGLYLLAAQWRDRQPSKIKFFLLGLVTGALPFAKLQVAPLALFLALVALGLIFLRPRPAGESKDSRPAETSLLFLGMALVPGWLLGMVFAAGAFQDFWISYIAASGVHEAGLHSLMKRIGNCGFIFFTESNFNLFQDASLGALVFLLCVARVKKAKLAPQFYWPLMVILAYGALTGFCILASGKPWYYYLLLALPPLAGFTGVVFFAARLMLGSGSETNSKLSRSSTAWLAAFALFIIVLSGLRANSYFNIFLPYTRNPKPLVKSSVADHVNFVRRPGDQLSVWGWMPAYYVETGLVPATRDAIGHYQISPSPYLEYHRLRYLADLKKSRPAVFIDAIGDGAYLCWDTWTKADQHESFPALNKFIEDNYALWFSIQLHVIEKKAIGSPVRIYLLKERMEQLHLTPGTEELPPEHVRAM